MNGTEGGAAPRPPRPPWTEFRAALDAAGFRPSRRLGQNFLLDENAARAIARDARVPPGELVVEVGPGCGFLSVHLAHAGARLVAVEVDPRLAPIAESFLAPYPDAEVLCADVLAGKRRWNPEVLARVPRDAPWHLVSNLPYSVGGTVLAGAALLEHPPASFTVLVQREVAERLAAAPGARDWGPLSVAVQCAYTVAGLRTLGPQLFWPRPEVTSRLVRGELRRPLPPAPERSRLCTVAARLLAHRRQGLARVVGRLVGDPGAARRILGEAGLAPERRAESLGLDELGRLARDLSGPLADPPP